MYELMRSLLVRDVGHASTQAVSTAAPELPHSARVHAKVNFSVLRSLPVPLAAIPERFSSSSLPPSFAQGRRAAFFTPQGTANRGALFVV
jgi:hypothetical protein